MQPHTIPFQQIGDPSLGYISVAEKQNLPFHVKRVFWTYYTPNEVLRGGHSHLRLEEIIVATAGTVKVTTEMKNGANLTFTLDSPNTGLYIPSECWRTLQFSHNAVLLTMASIEFDASEYIREYDVFKGLQKSIGM